MFVHGRLLWKQTIDATVWSYMAPTGYMKCAEQIVSEQTSKGAQAKNYAIQVVKSGDSVI